jgi:hypothetical protein
MKRFELDHLTGGQHLMSVYRDVTHQYFCVHHWIGRKNPGNRKLKPLNQSLGMKWHDIQYYLGPVSPLEISATMGKEGQLGCAWRPAGPWLPCLPIAGFCSIISYHCLSYKLCWIFARGIYIYMESITGYCPSVWSFTCPGIDTQVQRDHGF